MPSAILLAASLVSGSAFSAFAPPASDAELAAITAEGVPPAPPSLPASAATQLAGASDQVDRWWATKGLSLIADGQQPDPPLPALLAALSGLDPAALQSGSFSLHFTLSVTDVTRP